MSFQKNTTQNRSSSQLHELSGILQPSFHRHRSRYQFQLLTDEGPYSLEVPSGLEELFKRHTLERFTVKGHFREQNVFDVKVARLEPEEVPSGYDLGKAFDLDFFKRIVNRGFSLEPRAEEMAMQYSGGLS